MFFYELELLELLLLELELLELELLELRLLELELVETSTSTSTSTSIFLSSSFISGLSDIFLVLYYYKIKKKYAIMRFLNKINKVVIIFIVNDNA
jgi:hypothetical protein